MSWVPWQLLSILRALPQIARLPPGSAGPRSWLRPPAWSPILAGEPRAVDDAFVIVGIYAAWRVARMGRRAGPAAVSVAGGLVLGVCLGAVQWLPGLAAISTSQRDASSMALFSSGSLPIKWLTLTLVPNLIGGSGSLGQPSFLTSYNLTEVTSYIGILPLVAAFALLGPPPAAPAAAGLARLARSAVARRGARAREQHAAGRPALPPAVVR